MVWRVLLLVRLKLTDFSEESNASILRDEQQAKQAKPGGSALSCHFQYFGD
jgi:hypothetical protein